MGIRLKLNTYELVANIFNIYHYGPTTEDPEAMCIMKICYPIKKPFNAVSI